MRLCRLLITLAAVVLSTEIRAEQRKPASIRVQVTVENWDKGGALSHWVYTHLSEVFPAAVVRRAGGIVDLPKQLQPEIGGLALKEDDGSSRTLDQFVNDGAVDGCIVLHAGKIVYEKYPTIQPNDPHLIYSVTKAFVLTTLAILEDEGKIDLQSRWKISCRN